MEAVVIYGIKFDYNEALIVRNHKDYCIGKNEIIDLEDDPKYFLIAWDYFYSKSDRVCFRSTSPYYECSTKVKEYFIGVNLTNKSLKFIKSLDTESINDKIIKICKHYSLPYEGKTIEIHYAVDDC